MIDNFNNLIPSVYEIYSVFIIFILANLLLFTGKAIFKENNIIINFCIGWSLLSLIFLISLIVFRFNFVITTLLYFIITVTILIKFININDIKKIKILDFYFLIPIFFILLSTKTFGYDSFAYILDRFLFILENDVLPIEDDGIFRSGYTFTSLFVYYISNYPFNFFIENSPAIFDFLLLCISAFFILEVLRKNNFSNRIFIPISFLVIFYNPMIMNVYSYSSYEDLHVSFVLLSVYFFIYEKKANLTNLKFKELLVFGLLLSLLIVTKVTGVVHFVSIILGISFFILFLIKERLKKKIFIKYILALFLSLVPLFIWNYHLFSNNIQNQINFAGFRSEVLFNFLNNYYLQFLEKKILLFLNLFFLIIPFFMSFFKNYLKISYQIIIFTFVPLFIWNIFLLFFEIFLQTESHAVNLHNYFRFISQYSLVFTFLCLLIAIDLKNLIFDNYKANYTFLFHFFCIIFIITTLLNFEKIRRDINSNDIFLRNMLNDFHKENEGLPEVTKQYDFEFLKFYKKDIFKDNFE